MSKPRQILIDCDPGIDDALMLMMALASPSIDVVAITTVAGNVPLDKTSRNARIMCDLMRQADIPVYAGCPKPIARHPVSAEDFHGETGLDGVKIFEPNTPLQSGHAVEALMERIEASVPNTLTLVVTGPMTNIAAALLLNPNILNSVELVVMAGADIEGGNITPFAEFNVYADPIAAQIVFNAGAPITVLSLDATRQLRAEDDRLKRISAVKTERAKLMIDLISAANSREALSKTGQRSPMHDPSTIGWLLAPDIFQARHTTVSVNTSSQSAAFGQTRLSHSEGPHRWVTGAKADDFFELMAELMK